MGQVFDHKYSCLTIGFPRKLVLFGDAPSYQKMQVKLWRVETVTIYRTKSVPKLNAAPSQNSTCALSPVFMCVLLLWNPPKPLFWDFLKQIDLARVLILHLRNTHFKGCYGKILLFFDVCPSLESFYCLLLLYACLNLESTLPWIHVFQDSSSVSIVDQTIFIMTYVLFFAFLMILPPPLFVCSFFFFKAAANNKTHPLKQEQERKVKRQITTITRPRTRRNKKATTQQKPRPTPTSTSTERNSCTKHQKWKQTETKAVSRTRK